MIDKVTIYLADICLSVYLGLTVFIGWDVGNILIQTLLISVLIHNNTTQGTVIF